MSHRLNDVKSGQEFVTCAGEKITNLYSLSKALFAMSDDVFSHHVNSSKNDFYRWVFDVVKDYTLARQLNRAGSRAKMHRAIKQRIYDLEKTTENVVDVDTLVRNSERSAVKSLFGPAKSTNKLAAKKKFVEGRHVSNIASVLSASRKPRITKHPPKSDIFSLLNTERPKSKTNHTDVSHLLKGATSDVSHLLKGATSDVSHLFDKLDKKSERLSKHSKKTNKRSASPASIIKKKSVSKRPARRRFNKKSPLSRSVLLLKRLRLPKKVLDKFKSPSKALKNLESHSKSFGKLKNLELVNHIKNFNFPVSLHKLGSIKWKYHVYDFGILATGIVIGYLFFSAV